ncbi:MAG: alpha/beta hydrolase [Clostridia bacterium]|nr:alpha/beta hydrolase [Clostridia bacterium]
MGEWNGFEMIEETLSGRMVIVVVPKKPNGKWVLKTEYFDAFPNAEIELVKMGYHLAHIKNTTRWHNWSDTDARAELAEYMHKKYGVEKKCVIVGMSCGGMQGIYFASKYPELVSCMYLDAPVVNLLSCPAGVGNATDALFAEFKEHKKMDLPELIAFRDHPLDHIPKLVKSKIPVILVCGDSDKTVPYEENGKLLNDAYIANNCEIVTIIKKDCDHHPHGLEDNSPIIDFIVSHS